MGPLERHTVAPQDRLFGCSPFVELVLEGCCPGRCIRLIRSGVGRTSHQVRMLVVAPCSPRMEETASSMWSARPRRRYCPSAIFA